MASPPKKKKLIKKKGKNEIEKAKETVFRFLSYRPRSIEEVKRKLEEKGFSPLTIKRTLSRVKELGYLNDCDFAYTFARSSIENKQWGIVRIHDALLKKGISQEIINHITDKIKKEYNFTQVACKALDGRFAHFRSHQLVDKKTRNRAINYLRRKGFPWDTIFSLIKPLDE